MSFEEAIQLCRQKGKPSPIAGRGVFEPPSERVSVDDGSGNLSLAYGFGAQVVEVEVDPQTGDVKIVDVAAAADPGRVLNLLSLNG